MVDVHFGEMVEGPGGIRGRVTGTMGGRVGWKRIMPLVALEVPGVGRVGVPIFSIRKLEENYSIKNNSECKNAREE